MLYTVQNCGILNKFISIEELSMACPKLSQAHIEQLKSVGALSALPDESQMSFF